MAKTKTGRRFPLREKPATHSGHRCIAAIGQTAQPSSPLRQSLRGHCVAGLTIGSALLASSSAIAACSSTAPASGQTVTCDTAPPNPTSTNIQAAPGSSNVIINIEPNSTLAIARTTAPVAVGVDSNSQINNAGTISLTGGGVTESVHSVRANVFYTPFPKVDVGAELMIGERELENGADGRITRLQFTTKYSF